MSEEKSAPKVDDRGIQRIDIVSDHVEIHFPGGDWLVLGVDKLKELLFEQYLTK